MYIKQLEIDNFKSFANKSEIPLLKGFTTVSGPNGSGKSNIIDSVLFALGLANAGELRAENLSQFISDYTKRNDATVKVTFGDTDNGEDLTIARKIRKSTQGYASTYYVNDTVTTLTNVHALLEKYNVTPNSYNVMMQGDVMGITNCTPKQRRKIIDEIAGVAEFDRQIDKATNELTTVEQKVENATLILSEVDARLEELKEQREVALKYQKLKDDKTILESQISTVKYFDIKNNLEKAHNNILEFNKKKKIEEINKKDLEERLNLIKQEQTTLSEKLKDEGEGKQIELKKNEQDVIGEIERKKSAITYADKQIHDGSVAIENAKNGIEQYKKKITDDNTNIKLKQDEIKILEQTKTEKQTELGKIIADMTGLSDTADKYIQQRADLRKQFEDLQDKETNLIKEKLPLESELKQLRLDIESAENKITELENLQQTFNDKQALKQTEIEQLQKELEDFKIQQQKTMQSLDTVKNESEDLKHNIMMAYRKISTMEATKQAVEATTYGRAIEKVMDSNIKGIHAPLVKLGKVDKEYSTAMEVAFGGRMTHIVCNDEHVASVAIEILKSANAGRATFIPLTKVKKAPDKLQLPKDKGVIDFAINLVDFDTKYLDAFFYAVGDTLVVEDMECAKKLIGKYRMVTLQGELFEKSGSITGGSVRRNGLSFSQNDDEELETFKARLKEMEHKFKVCEAKQSELNEKLDTIRGSYSDSLNAFNQAKNELNNMNSGYDESKTVIAEKKEFLKEAKPKETNLNKKLDSLEEKHIKISDDITNIQTEITEIESLINDKDLQDLKAKTKDVEDEIKRLDKKITDVNSEVTDFNRDINFQNNLIESKKEDIESIKVNNVKLEKDKEQYAQEIVVLNKKLEQIQEDIKVIEEKLGELLTKRDEINQAVIELETNNNLKKSEIENIEEQIESFKARRRELEPELQKAHEDLENSGIKVSELEPVTVSIDEITSKIQRLEKRMEELGDVNMLALSAYEEVSTRQADLKEKIEILSGERKEILERMSGYEQSKKEVFLETYNNINVNFKEVFHQLSEGEGELKLEFPDNPLSGGLDMNVSIRDKKHQRLGSLSGGEKSLTALAFVFAIQRYMPAPFYAFDEVDANLDTMNVERIADMVQNQSKNTQFIVVSHRKPMIESANRTIGVTQKEKGITKVTGIKLRDE